MQSQRKLTLFLYRSLLRNSKKLDSQPQLKLLILRPLTNNLHQFLDNMFQSKSLYFDDDLYFSMFSLVKHVRMAFRYTEQLSSQFPDSQSYSEYRQLGFDALKQLNDCLSIAKYIQLDINEWQITPKALTHDTAPNKIKDHDNVPDPRNDDSFNLHIDQTIQHYKKCIAENPTAEAHNNLGWMCYLKGKYTEYFHLRNEYSQKKNSDRYFVQSQQSDILSNEKSTNQGKQFSHELSAVLPDEENVRSLADGINVCKKHCRIAISLDKEFGRAYNDLGLMLMIEMQKGANRSCDDEIEMLFGKAKLYQACHSRDITRSHPFKNHAKYLKNYKRDFKESLKNYIWAVHFDRDDCESREMIDKLLPTIANAANL